MSTYRFNNDVTQECKITTAPVTIENLKYFCGSYEQGVNLNYAVSGTFNDGIPTINYSSQLTPYYANTGLNNSNDNIKLDRTKYEINGTPATEKSYTRVVYILGVNFGVANCGNITNDIANNFEVVTNIERLNKITLSVKGTSTNDKMDMRVAYNHGTALDTKVVNTDGTGEFYIRPYFVTVVGTKTFIYRLSFFSTFLLNGRYSNAEQPFTWNTAKYTSNISTYAFTNVKQPYYIQDFGKSSYLEKFAVMSKEHKLFSDIWQEGEKITVSKTITNNFGQSVTTSTDTASYGAYIKVMPTTFDDLLFYAHCGLYFKYNNVRYKPVIQGGICTGYTTDMSKESDIDNWTDFNHNVPVPEDAETKYDRIDDMPLGYTGHVSSFGRYYKITDTNLARLSLDLAEIQDGIGHVISLKTFPVTLSNFATFGSTGTIQIDGLPAGAEINAQGEKVLTLNYDYLIGSIHIDGYHGTASNPHFLDYAPYTKLELYIPFCNFVELPSSCMYQNIDVYLLGDVIDGSCTGVVKCNGQIVAQKTGIIGHSSAISVTDTATRDNAIMQGLVAGVTQTAGLVTSAVAGNAGGFVNGVGGLANTATNTIVGMNANYTRVNGMNAGKVANALPPTCYLIRYRPDKIDSDNYKKTYGIPCNKTRQLANGDGFTVIDNFMANCNATQTEKDELKTLFRNGVIL